MHRTIACTLAAGALLVAAPAVAQVAGGLGGQVRGNAGVGAPPAGPLAGQAGDTLRGARDLTRDLNQGLAREARPDVQPNANADARAHLRVGRDGAEVDAALRTGVAVRSSDGVDLGSIIEVTRNEAGRAVSFLIRSADGTVRSVPAGSVSLDGGAVVTGWTGAQFENHPAEPEATAD